MSNEPITKEELASRRNNLYEWIRQKVIFNCTDVSHIEPCNVLINFLEKKGEEEYQIKSLRVALEIKESELTKKEITHKFATVEDQVMSLFSSGNHNIPQIAKETGISIYKVEIIIKKKFKSKK